MTDREDQSHIVLTPEPAILSADDTSTDATMLPSSYNWPGLPDQDDQDPFEGMDIDQIAQSTPPTNAIWPGHRTISSGDDDPAA